MTRLTETIQVAAAPRQIAEYLWEAANLVNYLPMSNVEILESGEDRIRVRHDLSLGSKVVRMVCVLEMAERNRKIRFHTEGELPLNGTWLLQETPGARRSPTCSSMNHPAGSSPSSLRARPSRSRWKACAGALSRNSRRFTSQSSAPPRTLGVHLPEVPSALRTGEHLPTRATPLGRRDT